VLADPSTAPSGAKYLRGDADRSLWLLKSPAPPPHTPDPETGGVPPYYYYTPITMDTVVDPNAVEPDLTRFAPYVLHGADLWRYSGPPIAPATAYYTVVGPVVETSGDPLVLPPTTAPLLQVRHTPADPSVDGYVWQAVDAPFYADTGEPAVISSLTGEWTSLREGDDWQRLVLSTTARYAEAALEAVSFLAVGWIDARIEVEPAAGSQIKVSAAMLDPSESVVAQYFDGGMTETLEIDDFLWSGAADASPSMYYYDRLIRARWLSYALQYLAPAGRPHQIFFNGYDYAYAPSDIGQVEATGAGSRGLFI
jgi:hypothetical protein